MNLQTYKQARRTIFEREYIGESTIEDRNILLGKLDERMLTESTFEELTGFFDAGTLDSVFAKLDEGKDKSKEEVKEIKSLIKEASKILNENSTKPTEASVLKAIRICIKIDNFIANFWIAYSISANTMLLNTLGVVLTFLIASINSAIHKVLYNTTIIAELRSLKKRLDSDVKKLKNDDPIKKKFEDMSNKISASIDHMVDEHDKIEDRGKLGSVVSESAIDLYEQIEAMYK